MKPSGFQPAMACRIAIRIAELPWSVAAALGSPVNLPAALCLQFCGEALQSCTLHKPPLPQLHNSFATALQRGLQPVTSTWVPLIFDLTWIIDHHCFKSNSMAIKNRLWLRTWHLEIWHHSCIHLNLKTHQPQLGEASAACHQLLRCHQPPSWTSIWMPTATCRCILMYVDVVDVDVLKPNQKSPNPTPMLDEGPQWPLERRILECQTRSPQFAAETSRHG